MAQNAKKNKTATKKSTNSRKTNPTTKMNWAQLMSRKRLGVEASPSDKNPQFPETISIEERTQFESDIDRIIYSGAFRRLGRKTQVHPLAANDHIHTRLAHSLEASRMGKALGRAIGVELKRQKKLPRDISPEDISTVVQAASLAHDLGNPPFGHGGEEAMAHWFEINGPEFFKFFNKEYQNDLINFEGNAQGFRILTQTERRLFKGGVRLTCATLAAFQKYPWTSQKKGKKFGAFLSEKNILEQVAKETGLIQKNDHEWCRHPLAYLVEAADDICYAIIDIEDAVELKIITYERARDALLSAFDSDSAKRIREDLNPEGNSRENLAIIRSHIFDIAVPAVKEGFMNGYDDIMSGVMSGSIFGKMQEYKRFNQFILDAKKIAHEEIFKDRRKIENEIGAYAIFDTTLKAFCEAAINKARVLSHDPKRSESSEKRQSDTALSWKSDLVLKLLGHHAPSGTNVPGEQETWTEYQCLRRVIDYVSGMTDNYATYISKQLQGMGFSGGQRP
ncbi:deoxyguanosinetriphosphate triphosphohydrolase [Ferrovibrio sp. MS7]|uniref:deoxyguanosinetriphosphate triphosphohydrolase n=1 Tax=Ferrovibrio plantarum TaxID=3119164 RepID=UPI003137642F